MNPSFVMLYKRKVIYHLVFSCIIIIQEKMTRLIMCLAVLMVCCVGIWSLNTTAEANIKADYEFYYQKLKKTSKDYIDTREKWLAARHQ